MTSTRQFFIGYQHFMIMRSVTLDIPHVPSNQIYPICLLILMPRLQISNNFVQPNGFILQTVFLDSKVLNFRPLWMSRLIYRVIAICGALKRKSTSWIWVTVQDYKRSTQLVMLLHSLRTGIKWQHLATPVSHVDTHSTPSVSSAYTSEYSRRLC